MRITYIHQYFNRPTEAGGTRSYEFARRLVAAGHQVNMLTTSRDTAGASEDGKWHLTIENGIKVHWLLVPYSNSMNYRARMRAFVRFARCAAFRAASIPCDIVFATSTPLTIALPAVWGSRKQHVPMVLEIRDLWPEVPIALGALKNPALRLASRWLEKFSYRNARSIIALSPGMKEGIVRVGYPAERVKVIPNASDCELFSVDPTEGQEFRARFDWLGERPLVVYVGTMGLVNGVEYLARVAAETAKIAPDIRFLVVGAGKKEPDLLEEAARLGVLGRSFFVLPKIPKSEVPIILSAADLATSTVIDVPELWNNSANKFFDSLASGTPIALNHQGWQADLLRKTGAGLVLSPNDYVDAAHTIVAFLRDETKICQAGRAARQLAEDQFDRDKLFTEFERVLLDAANGCD